MRLASLVGINPFSLGLLASSFEINKSACLVNVLRILVGENKRKPMVFTWLAFIL